MYDDAGHGNITSKVLDRKTITKTRPRMKDGHVLKNFLDMMTGCIESMEEPMEQEWCGPTIVYKNIFIYQV